MKLGLISDTPGHVPNAVHKVLSGVDHILHSGDVGPMDVLTELEAIAPVSAVLGNTDHGLALPATRVESFKGCKFLIHHIVDLPTPNHMVPRLITEENPQAVVFGHTHIPHAEKHASVWYLNPGSACNPRGGFAPSVAIVDLAGSSLRIKHYPLA